MANKPKLVCEACGAPLAVSGAGQDAPGPASPPLLCAGCAQSHEALRVAPGQGVNRAAILMSVGLFVLALSGLADVLAFGSHEGFGWRQGLGLGLAGVLVLTGAMMRIQTLFVIGLIIGLLTLLADWLGFGDAPGFGWQQISGSLLGAALIVIGLLVGRTPIRRD